MCSLLKLKRLKRGNESDRNVSRSFSLFPFKRLPEFLSPIARLKFKLVYFSSSSSFLFFFFSTTLLSKIVRRNNKFLEQTLESVSKSVRGIHYYRLVTNRDIGYIVREHDYIICDHRWPITCTDRESRRQGLSWEIRNWWKFTWLDRIYYNLSSESTNHQFAVGRESMDFFFFFLSLFNPAISDDKAIATDTQLDRTERNERRNFSPIWMIEKKKKRTRCPVFNLVIGRSIDMDRIYREEFRVGGPLLLSLKTILMQSRAGWQSRPLAWRATRISPPPCPRKREHLLG